MKHPQKIWVKPPSGELFPVDRCPSRYIEGKLEQSSYQCSGIAELNAEERQLIAQRQKDYIDYKEAKTSTRELATVKANIHSVLRDDQQTDKSQPVYSR